MQVHRHPGARALPPAALTIGNFDGVHRGHQALLRRLRAVAGARGLHTAVLTFEPHPREYFAPNHAPARITPLREKLQALAACGVDRVQLCRFGPDLAHMPARQFVEHFVVAGQQAGYVLVGDDFRFGAGREGDVALLQVMGRTHGFEVEQMATQVSAGERVSSSRVRKCLAAGDLAEAGVLLDRPYALCGRVVAGQRLGRTLGFPTANVHLRGWVAPLTGIFVVEAAADGGAPMPAVASLGLRPTVNATPVPTLEVHLLDFAGDLYGRRLEVRFLRKLRDEEKYPDLDTLRAQIARDADQARDHFARSADPGRSRCPGA